MTVAFATRWDATPPTPNKTETIVVARSKPDPLQGFDPYEVIDTAGDDEKRDKPWLALGQEFATGRELCCVYQDEDSPTKRLSYRRSIDSGVTWGGGVITTGSYGEPVGNFCATPAIFGSEPLYVIYPQTIVPPNPVSMKLRVLRGLDPVAASGVSPVQFRVIECAVDEPLEIHVNRAFVSDELPGSFVQKLMPQLAADPTDPERLFVCYHDLATAAVTDTDVNIYLQVVTRLAIPDERRWCAGPRIRVNQNTDPDADSFLPAMTVDDHGFIHIIYYDDRNYEQDDTATTNVRFDAFYAYSTDQGQNWFDQRLPAPSGQHAHAVRVPGQNIDMREYIGISWHGDDVWAVYTGRDDNKTTENQGVIWANRIRW